MNDWIPCSERLPPIESAVLFVAAGFIWEFSRYVRKPFVHLGVLCHDGDWVSQNDDVYESSAVTHWMELPEAPELPKEEFV